MLPKGKFLIEEKGSLGETFLEFHAHLYAWQWMKRRVADLHHQGYRIICQTRSYHEHVFFYYLKGDKFGRGEMHYVSGHGEHHRTFSRGSGKEKQKIYMANLAAKKGSETG